MKIDRKKLKAAMLERMKALDMNIATLARQAGLSYDTPRDFLVRDKSGMPGADKMVAMLRVLNLTHLLTYGASPERNGLKRMRQTRGYSINALATRMPHTTAKQLTKLEAGGPLSYEWKTKISEALECHPDDLDPQTAFVPTDPVSGASDHTRSWKGKDASKKSRQIMEGNWIAEHQEWLPGVPFQYLGKVCAVRLEDGKEKIRKIEAGKTPGRYQLMGIQPAQRTIKDALVVASALVVSLKQK